MQERGGPRRALWIAAVLVLALAAALPSAARRVNRLDVAVETPVYRLPPELPLHEGLQQYRLHWSGIPVARVQLRMRRGAAGRDIEIDVSGATHPVIDWLWRYRFEGHGRVYTDPFAPGGFVVDACERGEHQRTEVHFAREGNGVRGVRRRPDEIKEWVFESDNTLDIPSSVFLVLSLDYAPGGRFKIDTFTGKSRYLVDVEVQGREPLRLGGQEVPAWRLRLRTEELTDDDPEGRHRETLLWVTNERPRRLLRASSRTFVGSIGLELEPAAAPDDAGVPQARCT